MDDFTRNCTHLDEEPEVIGRREFIIQNQVQKEKVMVYRCPLCGTFFQESGFFKNDGTPSICELPAPSHLLSWRGYKYNDIKIKNNKKA